MSNEDVATPTTLDRGTNVRSRSSGSLGLVQGSDMRSPGNLGSHLLHKYLVAPSLGKSPHVRMYLRLRGEKPFPSGKDFCRSSGKPVDDLRNARFLLRPNEDARANRQYSRLRSLFTAAGVAVIPSWLLRRGRPVRGHDCRRLQQSRRQSSTLFARRLYRR